MQAIDLNAELERLHESLQGSKSDNAAMNIISLIREVYELYREQERDSDAEVFNYIKQRGEKEETERAAPVIKKMIEKEKESLDFYRKEFFKFLDKNYSRESFESDVYKGRRLSLSDYLDSCSSRLESAFIAFGDIDSNTSKGIMYWDLHEKWNRRVMEIAKEAQ